jgi:hypothetical protein
MQQAERGKGADQSRARDGEYGAGVQGGVERGGT